MGVVNGVSKVKTATPDLLELEAEVGWFVVVVCAVESLSVV
jgi:hypothetical protein